MAKYAEWYAVELDGYLRGRMSDAQLFEATKEIANHFAEHVDDLVGKGMDPLEAEKAAIKAFGSPRKAAMNLLVNSQNSKFGSGIGIFGMVATALCIFVLTFTMYGASLRFQVQGLHYYFVVAIGIAILGSASILMSSLFERRVAAKKFLAAWGIGLLATTFVCLLAGKPHFAGVPDRDIPNLVKQWKVQNSVAFKLTDIDQKLRRKICTSNSADEKDDLKGYMIAMKTEAPKLLEGMSIGYVDVVGQETSGYLVPVRSAGRQYVGDRFGFDFNGTPSSFPTYVYKLRYEKDPAKAVEVWRQDGYPLRASSESGLSSMAIDQFNFIASAEQLPAMSLLELILKSVGMVAVFTGLLLVITLCGSWMLLQVSSITFQASFRRKLA